jgi:hypothetical protein
MNILIRFSFLLVLFCNIGNSIAEESDDHLDPANDIFGLYNFQFDYYSNVRQVLFDGLSDQPEIRFLVLPSFSPENVLCIEQDRNTNKYYLKYHICKGEMIWRNDTLSEIEVQKFKKEIDKGSVELIKALFNAAISQTKFPENELIGFDGTEYYFTVSNMGNKTGTVWSPPKGSKTNELVEIGFKLINLAKSDSTTVSFNNELEQNIKDLTNRLKN